jgi:hypothetical protein
VRLVPRPIRQRDAFDFVARVHRHHRPPQGSLRCYSVAVGTEVCGVAIVGRPVARHLDDGETCEVIRLATNGTRNACSMLYAMSWRGAENEGYRRIVTYILESETGASLRASGWRFLWETSGGSWDRGSRPREDTAPTCPKQAWGQGDWSEVLARRSIA